MSGTQFCNSQVQMKKKKQTEAHIVNEIGGEGKLQTPRRQWKIYEVPAGTTDAV